MPTSAGWINGWIRKQAQGSGFKSNVRQAVLGKEEGDLGKDLKGKELGKNLYQRRDGTYEAKFTDNFGRRHSIYDKKLSDLRRRLNEALYKAEHNIYALNCSLKLSEWFDQWVEVFYKNTVKPVTYLRVKANFDRYIRNSAIGIMEIGNIRTIHIQKFVNELLADKNLKRMGIRPYITILRLTFQKAYECGHINKNPIVNIVLPKKDKVRREALTKREQELFLIYAQKSSYFDLFRFLLLTGMRIGEAAALTWDDIDLENNIISIDKTVSVIKGSEKEIYKKMGYEPVNGGCFILSDPKTPESKRELPINKSCRRLLLDMRLRRDPDTKQVFHTKNNTYINHTNVDARIKEICRLINERSGEHIRPFSVHTLRHTFATRCFENGVNPKTVQYLLGHTSAGTTMEIYTHVTKEQAKKEICNVRIID